MNHDYAHCMDYTPDCPMECFRARLTKEALDKHWAMASFMHFKGTDECKREGGQDNGSNNEICIRMGSKRD